MRHGGFRGDVPGCPLAAQEMEIGMTPLTYPTSRRAAVLTDFGEADNLSVREIATPAIRSDELLVRVKATSVNPIEWKMRRGLRLPVPKSIWRLLLGRPMILGIDFAGTVVAAGTDVEGYRIGDDVIGAFRFAGADAEYAVVRPADPYTAVAHKPPSLSHADAGAVPFAGLVALAGMTTHGGLVSKASSRVLVIGASGGVGHLAVQIAKRCLGAARVVGVCSSRNEDFVRQCGADEVVAYDRVPVESIANSYPEWKGTFDLIFDAVGIDKAWTVLAPWLLRQDGRFVGAALPQLPDGRAGEDVGLIGGLATATRLALRRMGGRYRFIYGFLGDLPSKHGFPLLVKWVEEGRVTPKLAVTYSLDQLADAHRASETGRTVGKISVVIP
jgi:NADPH:quinone reductase-like Zn-dependent oxidoreductase